MWQQLALAGLKSIQDEENRRNDLASNVITQKYSPWTGARADFSGQGKRNTMSNMIAGYGSGLLQDRQDELFEKEKQWYDQQANKDKVADWKSDADFYSRLSADPKMVGVTSGGASGGSTFKPIASKSVMETPPPQTANVPLIFRPEERSLMEQGRTPSSNSSFFSAIGMNPNTGLPGDGAPVQSPTGLPFNPWGGTSSFQAQFNRPLTPQEAQMPDAPKFNPYVKFRDEVVRPAIESLPDSTPLKFANTGKVPRSNFLPIANKVLERLSKPPMPVMDSMEFPVINPRRRPF